MWLKCVLFLSCLQLILIECHDTKDAKVKREPQFVVSTSNYTRPTVRPRIVKQYQPNWQSLDSRPLPKWYDDAKVGE